MKDYTKRKYVEIGKNRFDCWVFLKEYYKELGYDFNGKEFAPRQRLEGDELLLYKDWKRIGHPKKFDVALFSNKRGMIYHCGIMLNGHQMIHCCCPMGVVTSEIKGRWKDRLFGYYRLVDESCLYKNN